MNNTTRDRIRHIFLSPRPAIPLMSAAGLLGMTLKELKREIESDAIVAVSTPVGQKVPREEMVAVAMRVWEQGIIEDALGDDAAAVLPEAIRLVELRARVPLYQREMLQYLARQHGTSVDAVLTRELEDVACAHSEELKGAVPAFKSGFSWPECAADALDRCTRSRRVRPSPAS